MILKITLLIKILARSIGRALQIYKIGGGFVRGPGNANDALF
jgi:hypothetical protein